MTVNATALIVRQKGAVFEPVRAELAPLQGREVLVKLVATGICHTDLAVANGKLPLQLPAVLGHEGAGTVIAVGSEVQDLQVGDHVALSYNSCGTCRHCESKSTWRCQRIMEANFGGCRFDGSQSIMIPGEPNPSSNFFGQSSFCNPTIAQAASCVKVDPGLPLSVVCALGCGFQTGAGAVHNVLEPAKSKMRSLAVFGVGAVGCAAIMMAHYLSKQVDVALDTIIAVDLVDEKLQLAGELGATHVINSGSTKDVKQAILDLTDGDGVDAAIDCTAVVAVIKTMMSCLAPGGVAVTVGGPPPGSEVPVDVFDLLFHSKTYRGCHQGNAYSKEFIPFLADLYSRGELPVEKLQKQFKAENINDAVEQIASGKVVKAILLWF